MRVEDGSKRKSWRIFYRNDPDVIVVAGVEEKTTQKTPRQVIEKMRRRLKSYDEA